MSVRGSVTHWIEGAKRGDPAAAQKLWDRYWQRPGREREAYAHRYAMEEVARLRAEGEIPFPRIADADALRAEGLRPEDFLA